MKKFRIRNDSYMPILDKEGTFICPMPSPPPQPEGKPWHANLKPYERLYYHQTLASVRICKRYIPTTEIPRDSLDFQLQSRYDNGREAFAEKVDWVLQVETCAAASAIYESSKSETFLETFRLLRNTETIEIKEELGHPLQIGGLKEKISPHSIKLINSGPHTQLVNNGYSRQPADGNFFRY